MSFVHLHVHTDYSLLDGLGKVKDIVKKVKDSGMTACAITDHGTGTGLIDFYDECKKQGIKPLLGCEFYEAPESRHLKEEKGRVKPYFHLILIAKNEVGYRNLCKLITRSNTEGFYYKPRIDFELLEKFHDGLICLSACVAGRLPQTYLKTKSVEEATACAKKYKDLFGDDYYIELQNHGLKDEEILRPVLAQVARDLGVKIVATNDCHYVNSEDAEAHEWLLCMQTKKTINDPTHMRYIGDYSVKTEDEMKKLFPEYPEAIANTAEVADKVNLEMHYGDYRMPKVSIPKEWGDDYFGYMASEAWKGFEKRYPEGNPEREQAKADLEYELSVIKKMGFAEYFLDTRKTIQWSREHNILVGPGRGSAAGSRMCYCLGITDIDPIPYNLLFSRFLNPERISMPDIDVDYDYSHKDEVVQSESDSNGWDHFAKIQTLITMQAKAVIRDVVRTAEEPIALGNQFAKMIGDCDTLQTAYDNNPDLQALVKSSPENQKIWDIACKLEGTKKAEGTHACGHIPTPVPCEELFPCRVDQETGYLVCQYDMTQAEHLGNLKKDLLMLRNLTIIDVAQKIVKKDTGIDVPLWNEEILNNKKALDLIAAGDTNGVFQLESEGMKKFMRELKPTRFEDIIAGVALYRPGPMDMIPDYIRNKHHPDEIQYLTPKLQPILENTYGIIIFQEQVMQIVQALAGFSMGRADLVRKAMGKKKMDIMMEERKNFVYGNASLNIQGCIANGISEDIANEIYDQMISFAAYAFNKSHAAAYAAIAMQTAYLKANYPLAFYAGLLSSVMDRTDKLATYVNESKKKGIKILPPDINSSSYSFTVKDDSIVYGLGSIKGAGEDVVQHIIQERESRGPYHDFADFAVRVQDCNKGTIESFIKAGAFDFTGITRNSMLINLTGALKALRTKTTQIEDQISFFDIMDAESVRPTYNFPAVREKPMLEKLHDEKEATGLYVSGHPLDAYGEIISRENVVFFKDVFEHPEKYDRKKVKFCGIISKIKIVFTKRDNKKMCIMTVEDKTEEREIVVFPGQYEQYGKWLEENKAVLIQCNVQIKEQDVSLIADTCLFPEDIGKELNVCFESVEDYKSKQERFLYLIDTMLGISNKVYVVFKNTNTRKILNRKINNIYLAAEILEKEYGRENVILVDTLDKDEK